MSSVSSGESSWDRERMVGILFRAAEVATRSRSDLRREYKADRSIVTRADREIEALFGQEIDRPDRGTYLIGEETVEARGEDYVQAALAGECWVVDPIDGTIPYAYGIPTWGISVGRMRAGVLTDGAVYLPDLGELWITDGADVIHGTRRGEAWDWKRLEGPRPTPEPLGLLAVTQAVAKRGRVLVPNPVLVLGVAVVPMVGMLRGQFMAYLGSVKLWDIAGALPLLLRKGYSLTVRVGEEIRAVTERVEDATYHLGPGDRFRWKLRSDLLVSHPEDALKYRAAFRSGDE